MFSSPTFLFLFLPAVLALHTIAGTRVRNVLLLVASLVFYAWHEGEWVLLLAASIALNFVLGRRIQGARTPAGARAWLCAGAVLNLAPLFYTKYAGWISGELHGVFPGLPELGGAHLPIGISFFTFQAISYLVDVKRRDVAAGASPIRFGAYLSLFPQLVAGPIVRYRDVEEGLRSRVVELSGFAIGVRRFAIGLGKKLLIADVLARPVDEIFALPAGEHGAALAWMGIAAYSLQIYFDFSGYSDMAIGLGRMIGLRFLENFRHPYAARSATEFWRRWHISLSTWFRDYLYIPLGGNRRGSLITARNLLVVFFLCGLWHGAQWTFLVWGLTHGLLLAVERAGFGRVLKGLPGPVAHAYLLVSVALAWVFFRAPDLGYATSYLGSLFGAEPLLAGAHPVAARFDTPAWIALAAGAVFAMPLHTQLQLRLGTTPVYRAASLVFVAALLVASAMRLAAGTYSPFVYFRF